MLGLARRYTILTGTIRFWVCLSYAGKQGRHFLNAVKWKYWKYWLAFFRKTSPLLQPNLYFSGNCVNNVNNWLKVNRRCYFTGDNFRFLYHVKALTHANLNSFSFVNNYDKWHHASCALFDATSYFYFRANKAARIQTLHRRMLTCQGLGYKYATRLRKSVSASR